MWRTTLNRIKDLPRAGQWLVWAAVIIVVFLVYDEFALKSVRDWNRQSEEIGQQLDSMPSSRARQRDVRLLRDTIDAMGDIDLPGDEKNGRQALVNVVNEIKAKYNLRNDRFNVHEASNLPTQLLRGLTGRGKTARVVEGELQFEASHDDVSAIIRELEERLEIEQISSLNMRRTSKRASDHVTVSLRVQAWVMTKTKAGRGGGS